MAEPRWLKRFVEEQIRMRFIANESLPTTEDIIQVIATTRDLDIEAGGYVDAIRYYRAEMMIRMEMLKKRMTTL
jgi:hypothetical protein